MSTFTIPSAFAGEGSLDAPPVERSNDVQESELARDQELERLDKFFTLSADSERRGRIAGGATAIALGSVIAPVGAVWMAHSSDTEQMLAATTLGMGAGSILGGVLVLALRSDSERGYLDLAGMIQDGRRGLESKEGIMKRVEAAWAKRASELRAKRTTAGVIGVVFGSLGIVAAGTNALIWRDSKTQQALYNATTPIYLSSGILGTVSGIATLVQKSPLESSLDGYHAGKGTAGSSMKFVGVGYTPVAKGGFASLTFSF